MPEPKSVLLVTVDCLRADHCGFMGYPRLTTPFLDDLSNESFVFPLASAAGVPTYYSFPAIMGSRYPLAFGRELVGLAHEEKTLASVLKENGYATGFFGAGNPYLSRRFGYDFGFDTFRDSIEDVVPSGDCAYEASNDGDWITFVNRTLAGASRKVPGLAPIYDELYFRYCQRRAPPASSLDGLRRFPAADVMVDQTRTWLASLGGAPFFLWLHLMDPHAPYYPTDRGAELFDKTAPSPKRARYLNSQWSRAELRGKRLSRYRDEIVGLYDSGVRWVDAQLSRLVGALRELQLWESCIFAFTADHGEAFLEHDHRYHAPSLDEELINVPLLLRVPAVQKKVVSVVPFSLLHLAPTLLEAAGISIPAEFQGDSHWKHLQEGILWSGTAISECIAGCTNPYAAEQRRGARLLSVREARYKLLLNFDSGAQHLFDLRCDPAEQSALPASAAKDERRRLLQSALAHLQRATCRQPSRSYLHARVREIASSCFSASRSATSGVVA
jgi:arylsulfatase A-like enzyme